MKKNEIFGTSKLSFIKNILYKPLNHIYLYKKYKPIFKETTKKTNHVFLVYTPAHRNLGDYAIALAEMTLLNELGISFTEITQPEIHQLKEHGLLRLFNNTNIFINGGGNLGTLWFEVEEDFRDIMISAPEANILIFPSTIYYENTEFGRQEFKKSQKIYNNHRSLTLYARENISYEVMNSAYKNVKLVPDMVFSLNKCKNKVSRSGAVVCIRDDCEKTLTKDEEALIYDQMHKIFGENIINTDMCVDHKIFAENRNSELEEKFNQFRSAELVVTDRLHCMIFCAITGTPCIVVNSKSPKIKGCYEWIKEFEYIKFVDNLSDIPQLYNSIPQKEFTYDNSIFMPLFETLKEDIRNLMQ